MARPSVRSALPWVVLALVVAFVGYKLKTSHFDWAGFAASWRTADWRLIALAVLVIQANYFMRAMRWAVFLRPAFRTAGIKPVAWWALVGSQFVGFTGLAIFGRVGELIRPLLISRRTRLSFSSQIAVVAVERVFDLGAFGLIFSLNLLFSPQVQTLPYLHKAGYTIAALTLFLVAFVALVRLAGATVAKLAQRLVGLASERAGAATAEKILAFRDGLNVIDGLRDLALSASLSVLMWASIALTYVIALRAFPSPVHEVSTAQTIVLMGFSIAGSALPIPGGGGAWAGNVFALTNLFHIPAALAASSGLMVWLVTNMTVIPFGLIFARVEGVSILQVTKRSEAAEDVIAAGSNAG